MPRKTQPKAQPKTPAQPHDAAPPRVDAPEANLLCTLGTSPPVVTETLFGLCVQPDDPARPPVRVRELHIVTTQEGATKKDDLLRAIERMGHHYPDALPRLPAPEAIHVHVAYDLETHPLRDINDPKSNAAFSAELLRQVHRLTSDGMPPLHASLAGGRKTMSFFTGQIMGLLAREQDRLSHVLVGNHAERCAAFFYPLPAILPAYERTLRLNHSEQTFDASRETILLHEVPFVRLRRLLPSEVLRQATDDLHALIHATQSQVTPPLELHLYPGLKRNERIRIGPHRVKLSPMQGALYALLAQRAQVGREVCLEDLANPHRPDPARRPEDHEELRYLYEGIFTRDAKGNPTGRQGPETDLFDNPCEENLGNLRPNITKLSKALKKLPLSTVYHHTKGTQRGALTLALPPNQIIIHRTRPA